MPKPIRTADQRVVTTPNASMTTLASPTQGPSDDLAMWRVEMHAGQRGPMHIVCGHGRAIANVSGEDASRGTPPWIS